MDAQTIAHHYGGKQYGKSWRCRCPVHEGTSGNTLVLTDNGRDTPLVHCHGGCAFADLVARFRADGLWPEASPIDIEKARRRRIQAATEHDKTVATLAEARIGVIVAIIAGFGSIISEVGAVILVGGNIEGKTRTLTTAIVLETSKGNFDLAMALGIILLSMSFLINFAMIRLQGRDFNR